MPMPADPRALAVARRLIADPADQRGLADWAWRGRWRKPRTLSRVFSQGTGMSFTEWRIQVRVRAAMSYLAAGVPVSTVSRRVGYETPSAFTSVFRKVTGRTIEELLLGRVRIVSLTGQNPFIFETSSAKAYLTLSDVGEAKAMTRARPSC